MRHALLLFAFLFAIPVAAGCGGGIEPDKPATLTAEEAQEIEEQVDGVAASEEGKS